MLLELMFKLIGVLNLSWMRKYQRYQMKLANRLKYTRSRQS